MVEISCRLHQLIPRVFCSYDVGYYAGGLDFRQWSVALFYFLFSLVTIKATHTPTYLLVILAPIG